jgi:hypothetical protein
LPRITTTPPQHYLFHSNGVNTLSAHALP